MDIVNVPIVTLDNGQEIGITSSLEVRAYIPEMFNDESHSMTSPHISPTCSYWCGMRQSLYHTGFKIVHYPILCRSLDYSTHTRVST